MSIVTEKIDNGSFILISEGALIKNVNGNFITFMNYDDAVKGARSHIIDVGGGVNVAVFQIVADITSEEQ